MLSNSDTSRTLKITAVFKDFCSKRRTLMTISFTKTKYNMPYGPKLIFFAAVGAKLCFTQNMFTQNMEALG